MENSRTNQKEFSEPECRLCRPGGFHMTDALLSFSEPELLKRPLTVIDVGCGNGAAMEYLKERFPSWKITGIDPNPPILLGEMGRSEKKAAILPGEAESLPFSDHSADLILMECSFSKTWNPNKALREAIRVLKPEGWLLMSDMYAKKEEFGAAADPLPEEEAEGCAREEATRFEAGRRMSCNGILGRLEFHQTIWKRLRRAGFSVVEMQDKSGELIRWIGQKIMDGEAGSLYAGLGVDRDTLKRAGCGYYICAAKPSGLWETLKHTVDNSSFYRKKWGQRTASSWEEFTTLPFSSPEEVREDPEAFVCVNPKEIARIITLRTSGSQGKPKRIYFTEEDLIRTADFFEKGMQFLIAPGDRVTVYMEGPGRFSVGGLMKEGLARIGSETRVHGLIRDMEAAAADGEATDCFIGVPSQMYGLAVHAPHLRPKAVLLSADYVPESVCGFLEKTWKCKVYTHWGMTETGYGGGVQCGAREGYHLRDDDLLIEVIDPETGRTVADGEYGELVLTTLRRKGMPLIRYRTGDLGRMLYEPCGCGCLKPRLDKVEGRLDDCLRLSGGEILSMHLLDELIFAVEGVKDFEAEVRKTAGEKEEKLTLAVFVLEKDGMTEDEVLQLHKTVKNLLKERWKEIPDIEVCGKQISPYIGSGKRKLKVTAEEGKQAECHTDHI